MLANYFAVITFINVRFLKIDKRVRVNSSSFLETHTCSCCCFTSLNNFPYLRGCGLNQDSHTNYSALTPLTGL